MLNRCAALLVASLFWAGCRGAGPVRVVSPPRATEVPAAVREAVRRANRPALGTTWRVQRVLELGGRTIERYRLGGGPTLLLLPEPAGRATTVQVWLPFGWADEPLARRGAARRWAAGWPASPLGGGAPTEAWSGAARDLSGAGWTVASADGLALVEVVAQQWPTRTSTPALSELGALEHRLRRTLWDVVAGAAPASSANRWPDAPARAVWVVAGALDRARVLTAARRALATAPAPPPDPVPRSHPGPGPRVPVEVPAPEAARVALLAWTWPTPSPPVVTRLSALAHLLARGPQARLRPLLETGVARGIAVDVEAGPGGVSFEALVRLGPTGTATHAAAGVRRALAEIGEGRTTGLELERLRHELDARRLRGWSRLEGRARAAAEAVLVHDDLSALEETWRTEEALDEPALRALSQTLSTRHPVVVEARAR